jgi:hypothetical protein
MTNAEIVAIAQMLTADARVFGWTSTRNGRTIEIHAVVTGADQMFQMRDTRGPRDVDVLPYPLTEQGIAEARRVARDRAEINEL